MIEKQISAKIMFCSIDELTSKEKEIIQAAKECAQRAYSPYSKFSVGAAILLDNGEIVCGNNQENTAFPSGLCAERVAMFSANANFPHAKPLLMAIAAKNEKGYCAQPISPCGACRQVLVETEKRFKTSIRLLLYGEKQLIVIDGVGTLLPLTFDF